jgi:hypothetical protein
MAWRSNTNFGDTSMKAWIDDNNKLNINFGKFDGSCKDGVWTFYIPINVPTGNKFRSLNARYELIGKATFVDNNSSVVKRLYIEDIKETNP